MGGAIHLNEVALGPEPARCSLLPEPADGAVVPFSRI